MKKLNISLDVGGTHSRLQCEICENGRIISTSGKYQKVVGSKASLQKFIQSSLRDFSALPPAGCVIGFAGAVIDRREVAITNWKDRPVISLPDLIAWGLPENTFLVNDMELAAYGLLNLKESKMIPSDECKTLFQPEAISAKYPANMLVIAPGTGFGTGSIIEITAENGKKNFEILASEVQHIQIPPLDETHEKMIRLILSKNESRRFLSYEDFVSGQGLQDTYQALLRLNGKKPNEKTAAEIAEAALQKTDDIAVQSLHYFYRITGRLVQAMCLTIQPYGGVFLCGASTERNAAFIPASGFLQEMHNCLVRKQLLEQFPVFIITKSDVNLAGGLWACRNIL